MNKQTVTKITALSNFGRNRSFDMTLKFDSLQAQGFVTHNKAEAANYEPHLKFCFFVSTASSYTTKFRELENKNKKWHQASASCSLRHVLRHEPLLLLSASLSCSLCPLFFFLSLSFFNCFYFNTSGILRMTEWTPWLKLLWFKTPHLLTSTSTLHPCLCYGGYSPLFCITNQLLAMNKRFALPPLQDTAGCVA